MRRVGVASALVLAGCIATNPSWDSPVSGVVTVANESTETTGDERGGSGSTSSAESGPDTSSDATSSSGPGEEPMSSDDGAAEVTDDGAPPPCAAGLQLCAGICAEIDHDKHACGEACVDCTARYGNNAMCVHGECAPHDSGGGDDD